MRKQFEGRHNCRLEWTKKPLFSNNSRERRQVEVTGENMIKNISNLATDGKIFSYS